MADDDASHGFVTILLDEADAEAKAEAGRELYRYNVERTGVDDRRPLSAKLLDPVTGEMLGGLWGRTELGLLLLDMFFLRGDLRGRSLGGELLFIVEKEARRRGCRTAVVETSTFQAPSFYVRHGYVEFGRVAFGIPGHARVFLKKDLV